MVKSQNQLLVEFLYFTITNMKKQDKENLINELLTAKEKLSDFTEEPENVLIAVRNLLEEYGLEYSFRYLWEDWMTWDELDEMVKYTAEDGALRMYYFMGDCNFASAELVRLDGYGNCEEVSSSNLESEIDNIIEQIDDLDEGDENGL